MRNPSNKKFAITKSRTRLFDLYVKENLCVKDIAALLNTSDKTIRRVLREEGISIAHKGRSKKLALKDEKDIGRRYFLGESLSSLKSEYKVSLQRCKSIITSQGFTLRNPHQVCRRYRFDVDCFSEIDTQEKAYWLGFIMADGCVMSNDRRKCLTISLKESDASHLHKFKLFARSTHPLKKTVHHNPERVSVAIVLHSKKLVEDLKKWEVTPRKTFTIKLPDIPDKLFRHFLRGYFDGDGCWVDSVRKDGARVYSWSITCGSKGFLENLQEKINAVLDLGKTKINEAKHSEAKTLKWGGRNKCALLSDYMYQGATVYLDRKHDFAKKYFFDFEPNITPRHPNRPAVHDLTGQVFGNWKVLRLSQSQDRKTHWLCQCSCGVRRDVEASTLKRGSSRSCGCVGRVNIQNEKFQEWTVLSRSDRKDYWYCRCSCGVEKDVHISSLRSGRSRSCGCAAGKIVRSGATPRPHSGIPK